MKTPLSFLLLLACGHWSVALAELPVPVSGSRNAAVSAPSSAAAPSAPAAPAVGLLNGYMSDDSYKLRVGDAVSFQILEDRVLGIQETPVNLVVTDSGEIDVTYIGRVMAVGKTSKELAADLKTALEKEYYKKASVVLSLNVATRILGRVYIWGQVRSQGALDMQINENLTAGNAILRAGGFGDFASKTKVKVVRAATGTNGEKQTFSLNMEEILEKGKIEKDILLQPNDLIIVPTRLVNF
ncbi:MAG: polysaccharide biosynthesis/export family protein [Verrucomicrobiota bacterium]